MIDKIQVENFLKANGIPPSAKDEEIRSMLLSARWNNNEVDTALMVLKENLKSKATHIDTLHKVFQTDERLSPSEISALLGIDVNITQEDVNEVQVKLERAQKLQVRLALALSVLIAFGGVMFVMYQEKAGVFHQPATVIDAR